MSHKESSLEKASSEILGIKDKGELKDVILMLFDRQWESSTLCLMRKIHDGVAVREARYSYIIPESEEF